MKAGFVYFMRSGDFVKIGYSSNPRARLSDLRSRVGAVGWPTVVCLGCLPADPPDERAIQISLGLKPILGPNGGRPRDWFALTDDGLSAISNLITLTIEQARGGVHLGFLRGKQIVPDGDRRPILHCNRCLHSWKRRKLDTLPGCCPSCTNTMWNREKVYQ